MKKIIIDILIFAISIILLTGCKTDKNVVATDESAAAALSVTGTPGPVTLDIACDVANDFTWVANDYDETVIAITDIQYELGNPGKATLTITPVAPGTTTALFVYCQYGMVEANVKGYAEYQITIDENNVISYEQVKVKFESQYDPGRLVDAGAQPVAEDAPLGAVYEDVGEVAEYEQIAEE